MPICDEETRERGKSPKTDTEKAEKEGTDSEEKENNTKRTKAQGKKEDKKPNGNRGNKKDGYMMTSGKPRQPRKTQENKTGTLRYEHETETWHCAKCSKNTPNKTQQARKITQQHTRRRKKETKKREKRKQDEKKQIKIRMRAE